MFSNTFILQTRENENVEVLFARLALNISQYLININILLLRWLSCWLNLQHELIVMYFTFQWD